MCKKVFVHYNSRLGYVCFKALCVSHGKHIANPQLFLSISLLNNIKGFLSFHASNSQKDYERVLRQKLGNNY